MSQPHSRVDSALFRAVVATTAEGILVLDTGGAIVFANRYVERLLGYDRGELGGRPIDRLFSENTIPPLDLIRARADRGRARSDGGQQGLVLADHDGNDVPVTISARDIEYDDEQFYTVTVREAPERRGPNHRLEAERHRRATLFENSSDPIVDCDFKDGAPVIRAVNDAFERVFGYDAEDVVGRTIDDVLVPEEEYEEHRSFVGRLLRDEEVKAEVRRQTVDGPREFLAHVVLFEADGTPGAYAIYADITERKQREREIREAKKRFETIFEHANDAILIFDPERNEYEECNPQACDLLGYSRDELLDLTPSDVHVDELSQFGAFIDEVLAEGAGWTDELCCYTSGEEVLPTEISASRIEIDDRPHVLALVRDVSERRRHEREIRQRSAAMETATDGMAILDEDETYVYVNEAHAEIYGYDDPGDLVGETWQRLYDEAEIERLASDVLPTVRREGRWRGEAVGRRRDGSTFPQELTLTELDHGVLVYAVRDITERKAHERKLEALNEASRDLMVAETTGVIARRALETVERVLGSDVSCVRLFDPETNVLEPVAMTDRARELVESCVAFDLDATLAGRAYRQREMVITTADEGEPCRGGPNQVSLHLPLGDYGTLTVFTRSNAVEELDAHCAELLAADVRAALERDEREQILRRNQRELRQQHDQLDTFNQITTLVQELIRRLINATTREEINQVVCDRLAASDFYESAWIGAVEMAGEDVTPQVGAGVDDGYLDALDAMPVSQIGNGVVARAIRSGEVQVIRQYQVAEHEPEIHVDDEPVPREVEAVAAIPITYGDRIYGVLVVSTSREDVFSETQIGFGVLGDVIGFAINAALNRELLLSDSVVELEFEVTDPRSVAVTFSDRLGSRCQLEQETALEDGKFLCYLRVRDASVADVLAVADDVDAVEDSRIIGEHDGEILLELVKTGSASRVLMGVGATVRSTVATDGVGRLVAEAPLTADVRNIVEAFRALYPESTLVAKRDVNRPVKTAAEFRDDLEDRLTDKQKTAIESAYASGYYDWPRKNTAAELADSLGISSPTLHQHLRKAEQKLLEAFISEAQDHHV
ncbi:PAS domain S-box protein [Halomarina halobia]|uniref:PAS domain S-box protein n=1 Tax=Halomarina halobia TaxID=3033386 RepID=A0ABD6A961_9EURY|nr:PAS domain S-box protein [Halomarina sp. PSR21]